MSVSMNPDERMKKYMKEVFDSEKPYTFISYSHNPADVEKVYTLLDELMKRGINFAIDTEYAFQQGSWMDKMNKRLSTKECKCMLSFYSKSYVYSRPSLLEQFLRYSAQVKEDASKRQAAYAEEKKKEMHGGKYLPSIAISLFESKGIKKQIANKDDEQIQRIKAGKSDWEMDLDSKVYKLFKEGLSGYFKENESLVEMWLDRLGDAQNLDYIRECFLDKILKDEDNANFSTEVDEIEVMLASFGVKEDEVIKQRANALFDMSDGFTGDPVKPGNGNDGDKGKGSGGIRYRIAGKKYDAVLRVETKNERESYIVETGSKIAPEWTAWVGNKKKKEITDTQSVDGDYRVIREVEFDAISAVGKFIMGMSTSGSKMLTKKNLISTAVVDTGAMKNLPQPDEQEGKGAPDEPKEPDGPVVPAEGARYVIRGKKYDAILRVENRNGQEMYVVEKGSRIAQDWEKYIGKSDMQKIQSENCVGEDSVLKKDTCFSAISAAGKFIKGVSTDGNGMVTEDHRLDDGFNDINTKKTVEGLGSLL